MTNLENLEAYAAKRLKETTIARNLMALRMILGLNVDVMTKLVGQDVQRLESSNDTEITKEDLAAYIRAFVRCHTKCSIDDEIQFTRDECIDLHQLRGDLEFPNIPDAGERRRLGKAYNYGEVWD